MANADLAPAPDDAEEGQLRSGRLGVIGIVFFVVAAAAPLVGMTGAVPVAIVAGNGAGVPGAYLVVGLTLIIFSVGYAAMSHQVTNTGAFFAYVGRGLGIAPGVGSAFVSLVAYIAIQLAIFGFFGAVAGTKLDDQFGISWKWWVWALLAWALVLALSLASVDVGAKVLGVLMILEVSSLVLMSIAVFAKGGPEPFSFSASFAPKNIFVGGFGGSAGIALAFAFASYIGFEATAIYGEESKDPKKSVPRATYVAVTLITVLFAISALAIVTALGSSTVIDKTVELSTVDKVPLADPAQVIFSVADKFVGSWLGNLMSWLVISSLFAGLLAFQNSASRYFFAMGRGGVLPRVLDRTNKLGAPHYASILTSVISAAVIIYFAASGKDPVLNLFFWFSALAVVAIVLVEALVCLAVIAFFRRDHGDKRVWNTIIAPAISFVGLVIGLYLLMSRFGLLAGTAKEGEDPSQVAWSLNTTGWVLVLLPFVLFIIGTVVGALRKTSENRDSIEDLVT